MTKQYSGSIHLYIHCKPVSIMDAHVMLQWKNFTCLSNANKNIIDDQIIQNQFHLETRKISGFRGFDGVEVELPVLESVSVLATDFAVISSLIRLRVASIASGTKSWTALLCNAFIAIEAASFTSCGFKGANKQ